MITETKLIKRVQLINYFLVGGFGTLISLSTISPNEVFLSSSFFTSFLGSGFAFCFFTSIATNLNKIYITFNPSNYIKKWQNLSD